MSDLTYDEIEKLGEGYYIAETTETWSGQDHIQRRIVYIRMYEDSKPSVEFTGSDMDEDLDTFIDDNSIIRMVNIHD